MLILWQVRDSVIHEPVLSLRQDAAANQNIETEPEICLKNRKVQLNPTDGLHLGQKTRKKIIVQTRISIVQGGIFLEKK